jgi:hypothetical protein
VTQFFKLPVFSVSGTCFRRRAGLGCHVFLLVVVFVSR